MPKAALVMACLALLSNAYSHGRFYTYNVRRQIHADSMRVIDSARAADSAHLADSLMIRRYAQSDEKIGRENEQHAREAKAEDSARKAFVPIGKSEMDIFSSRSVVIAGKDGSAGAVDSIQKAVDSINAALYQNDSRFQKMKQFPLDEKKRYLRYLLEYRLKDTAEVVAWCERMQGMLNLELTKINLLLKTQQDENTRTFLMAHLKMTQEKLAAWSDLLLALAASKEKSQYKPAPAK